MVVLEWLTDTCVSPASSIQGMAVYSLLLGTQQLVLFVRKTPVREALAILARHDRNGKSVVLAVG
jgi:hypothetical protein